MIEKCILVMELSFISANSNVLKATTMSDPKAVPEQGMVPNALDSFYKLILLLFYDTNDSFHPNYPFTRCWFTVFCWTLSYGLVSMVGILESPANIAKASQGVYWCSSPVDLIKDHNA